MSWETFFCVIGMGKSGFSAAELLLKKNIKTKVTEIQNNLSLRKKASYLRKIGAEVELGKQSIEFCKGASIYVISPGVPKTNSLVEYIKRENLPLISEIELAWMFSPAKVIAITGTNGKTSVATYTYEILKQAGISTYLAGNIGLPFSNIVLDLKARDTVVLELSSFQLEDILYFHPFIAVLTNVSEDHLDRYQSQKDYIEAKFNIFKNQTSEDIAILDLSLPIVKEKSSIIHSNIIDLSKFESLEMDLDKKFVYLIGKSLGLDNDFLLSRINSLKGLEHRMEDLGFINGIRFVNDSKATNPHATKWALRNINSKVILIAGGRDKNMDFGLVEKEVSEKVRVLILLGEAKQKILNSLSKYVEVIKFASDLEQAVKISFQEAKMGESVLLSPMCASFDMFKNYEERGSKFKSLVQNIKKCRN